MSLRVWYRTAASSPSAVTFRPQCRDHSKGISSCHVLFMFLLHVLQCCSGCLTDGSYLFAFVFQFLFVYVVMAFPWINKGCRSPLCVPPHQAKPSSTSECPSAPQTATSARTPSPTCATVSRATSCGATRPTTRGGSPPATTPCPSAGAASPSGRTPPSASAHPERTLASDWELSSSCCCCG